MIKQISIAKLSKFQDEPMLAAVQLSNFTHKRLFRSEGHKHAKQRHYCSGKTPHPCSLVMATKNSIPDLLQWLFDS